MSVADIKDCETAEQRAQIHALRSSLVDAFLSIVNGLKGPGDDESRATAGANGNSPYTELDGKTHKHVTNMFFYLETLVGRDDLETSNAELARQIIDLYSDIVVLNFGETRQGMHVPAHENDLR